MKHWFIILFYIVVIFSLILSTVLLIEGKAFPDKPADIFGYELMVVVSGSMEPSVPLGSIIVVKNGGYGFIKPGEIITFRTGNTEPLLITHRVAAIKPDGSLVTKGDANSAVDNVSVGLRDVVGKVSFTVPYVGYLAIFARSKWGGILIRTAAGVLALIVSLDMIKGAKRKIVSQKNRMMRQF
ncbi:signal peptidase I [Metallumcola ferriviriculae]|uniref:Signal peptidase I n=1 Tax=Metallumcola ferriviriculae TaxID=3039180 RepID=A0AAU0ULM8_9FIRM|nr:signal peptidase I [Desulfitibacteraceae bacterium MK1]